MSWMSDALESLWDVVGELTDLLTTNSFLSILLVASLVIVACKVFKRIKKTARS